MPAPTTDDTAVLTRPQTNNTSRPDVPHADDEQKKNSAADAQRMTARLLAALLCLALMYTLYLARAVVVPVTLALILALTQRPIVRFCKRRRIPPWLTAAGCVTVLAALAVIGVTYLIEPAQEWISAAPDNLEAVGEKLRTVRQQLTELNETSKQMEDLAAGDPADRPLEVEVKQPRLMTSVTVLNSTGGVLAATVVTLVVTYFLLATGDTLINNTIHVLPTIREKRKVVELVHGVEQGISRYLLTITVINACLGIAIGTAMWLLGMPNPALWGLMAAVFNFLPYLGALAGVCVVFLVAVLSFDSLAYAALVPLVYFSLTALEGNLITPSVLGRFMQLNPLLVFLSLVFWGWMWGVPGALLAVPLLAITRLICERFERTRAIAVLLSD